MRSTLHTWGWIVIHKLLVFLQVNNPERGQRWEWRKLFEHFTVEELKLPLKSRGASLFLPFLRITSRTLIRLKVFILVEDIESLCTVTQVWLLWAILLLGSTVTVPVLIPVLKSALFTMDFLKHRGQWNSSRPIYILEFSRGKRSAMAWLPGLWVGGWMDVVLNIWNKLVKRVFFHSESYQGCNTKL